MALSQDQLNKIVALARTCGATRRILFDISLQETAKAEDVDSACDGVTGWKLFEFGARLEEELCTSCD